MYIVERRWRAGWPTGGCVPPTSTVVTRLQVRSTATRTLIQHISIIIIISIAKFIVRLLQKQRHRCITSPKMCGKTRGENSRPILKQEAFEKWPIRHCEPPHALILHCHSPGVATVPRRHCRTPPAHRCPRQRQRVTEGTAGPIEWAQSIAKSNLS